MTLEAKQKKESGDPFFFLPFAQKTKNGNLFFNIPFFGGADKKNTDRSYFLSFLFFRTSNYFCFKTERAPRKT